MIGDRVSFLAILFSLFGSQIAALAAVQGIGVELSPRSVPVGEGTVLSVRVQGGGNENKPVVKADPAVRIQEAGANTNVQLSFMNGRTQKVNDVTFRYVLRGLKKGTFEIKVEVPDGDEVLIPADPVILTVRDKTDMELKMEPFLKVNLDKASLYAGESVPIELSLYYPVETRIRQVTNRPVIPADGVLIEEMGEWMKGGEVGQHAVAIVRGRLTTLKPGKFRIGPAEVSLALSLPRHLRLGSTKSYALKSDAIELEVKPLPSTGVPEGFAGLVGNYQVEIDASPLKLDSSDPISLKLRVTGKGDLRKVEIPKMTNNQGWRHYEPERFEEKNREGELTGIAFTQVIVPQADHDVIPSFRLPHFDPDQGRYIVAATAPIPIKLNYREQSSTASPVIASNETTDPRADEVPDAVAPPLAEMTDILGIRTGFAQTWATGRTSFLSSPVFWAVQAVPASLLAVILGAVARRKILERRAEKKLPTWSETHSAFNGIAASATAGEFYRYAVEGLNAWERENKDRLPEDEEVIEGMRRIRGKHDFIEFGGVGTAGEKALDGSERERVKKTMAALEKLRSAALRS